MALGLLKVHGRFETQMFEFKQFQKSEVFIFLNNLLHSELLQTGKGIKILVKKTNAKWYKVSPEVHLNL